MNRRAMAIGIIAFAAGGLFFGTIARRAVGPAPALIGFVLFFLGLVGVAWGIRSNPK